VRLSGHTLRPKPAVSGFAILQSRPETAEVLLEVSLLRQFRSNSIFASESYGGFDDLKNVGPLLKLSVIPYVLARQRANVVSHQQVRRIIGSYAPIVQFLIFARVPPFFHCGFYPLAILAEDSIFWLLANEVQRSRPVCALAGLRSLAHYEPSAISLPAIHQMIE
jgi:hypothetical protein